MRWLPLLLVAGCAISDGEAGDRGIVRFSLVHDYSQSRDLSSPIAVGRTILIAIQRPDGNTFTELELAIEDPSGDTVDAIAPLGFAQYAVVLDEPGLHRLVATDRDGRPLDSLSIRAEEVEEIVVDETVLVTTLRDDGIVKCAQVEEQALKNVVLHQNQTIEMFVVPRSRLGEPMIGLLALTASGPVNVELHAPLTGEGRFANALIVDPIADLDQTVELVIEDDASNRRIETPIAATNEQKLIACQG
jgi:hypothetical protein